MAEETPDDEDIEFPAISPAPVLIALLNLVQALVIWVAAVPNVWHGSCCRTKHPRDVALAGKSD